ncbi:molybdopterin-dependent oxidoreductase [Nocardioides sp. cx-173]|uniref:molybdopterin-dependent oxidoreductase n=1 Tax=Nocardioides sp. cx-173 TaxID=2898796 RepID=UPI001E41828F|nr:molybdopterin-dependent oxidoreductase [Nocardioides sp. cx-173]MCD4523885.1 molybdopterin-dependent oxidoreductase [Nocardioides sp. cx-173]UGB41796.1 molybdopterin-dependent oxidoreductase [Nocardioides sp. cx-173]
MRSRLIYAGFGLLAALLGVGAGHLTASLLDPASSPVLAVGSTVIDLTPTPMKEWAIREFGSSDKTILVGSVLVGVLLLAAVAGLLARRRLALGAGLLLLLVGVAAAAAMSRPTADLTDLLPALVTALAGVGALAWLDRAYRSRRRSAAAAAEGAGPSRRGVVVAAAVVAVAAAALGGAGRVIGRLRSRPEDVDLPTAADPSRALPEGIEGRVPGMTPFRTPNKDFYRVDTRLDTPVISADDWTLTIDGDVERELTFSFDDLLEMPLIERDITLTCVSNSVGGEYVGAARWTGVRLTDLLDQAGVGSGADQILSTDFEGMTISTPLELATDGRDAMVALGMNGEGLPRAHGFPARLVIPGLYGFISATKWVTRLTLTTYADRSAYWTDREWATDAPIKLSARIDTPNALDDLPAGENLVGGVAWAQQRGGVAKVEVRVDGGAWQAAELGPDGGNDYWRQWFYRWDAAPGSHSLAARVTSGDGERQTTASAEPFPEGSSGLHELLVNVD